MACLLSLAWSEVGILLARVRETENVDEEALETM
jgi:hypothetical protein